MLGTRHYNTLVNVVANHYETIDTYTCILNSFIKGASRGFTKNEIALNFSSK